MDRRLGLLAWLVPLGGAALVAALGTRDPADLPYFVGATRTLFSPDWAETFSDPLLQVGPLFLALVGLFDRIGGSEVLAYGIQVGVAALLVFTVGRVLRGRPFCRAAQSVTGLAGVALGLTADAYSYGHPAQVVVPLLWLLAGSDAREGRAVRAGALVGLSAGFELWGVLGAPALLLAPAWGVWARAGAVQAGITLGLYLPFVLAGDFRMFDLTWKVEDWTPISFFIPAGEEFPWTFRLVQGAAAIAAGALLALVVRRSPWALWAVPLAVVAVRMLFDPAVYTWYWLGLATLALVAAADLVTGLRTPYVAAATRAWSRPNP